MSSIRFSRNGDKRTCVAQAESNIMLHLEKFPDARLGASSIAYIAFPEYAFRTPQGAALAVSKILRGLQDKGCIRYYVSDFTGRGYGFAKKL